MTFLLGLDFLDADAAEAARAIAARAADAPFAYVVTPNADHIVRLHRRPELRSAYQGAALRLLDSRVIALAAAALRLPCPAVAPGSEVTENLLAHHLHPGERITVIGLQPSLLENLIARYAIAPPAHYDPPMGFDSTAEGLAAAVRFVLAHPARLVFLAVGSPRQEILAAAITASGHAHGTGLCIGASLEFLAGKTQRAPAWMQRAGLEWLHRLAHEPRRLARRYLLDNPPIFALLLRARFARKARGSAP